jgi:hypothetical protein
VLSILYGRERKKEPIDAGDEEERESAPTAPGVVTPLQLDVPLLELVESAAQILRNAQLGPEASYSSPSSTANGAVLNLMSSVQANVNAPRIQALEMIKSVLYYAIRPSEGSSGGGLDPVKVKEALESVIEVSGVK